MQKPVMSRVEIDELWSHFYKWSGGFAPASFDQITIYLDYAYPGRQRADVVRRLLCKWMNKPDYFESREGKPNYQPSRR